MMESAQLVQRPKLAPQLLGRMMYLRVMLRHFRCDVVGELAACITRQFAQIILRGDRPSFQHENDSNVQRGRPYLELFLHSLRAVVSRVQRRMFEYSNAQRELGRVFYIRALSLAKLLHSQRRVRLWHCIDRARKVACACRSSGVERAERAGGGGGGTLFRKFRARLRLSSDT